MYEDDPCIFRETRVHSINFDKLYIKIDDEIYDFVGNAESLEAAKDSIGDVVRFSKFSVKSEEIEPGFFSRDSHKRWVICDYCGAHAVCEAKISLRKITIYKRPPIGVKYMKIQVKSDDSNS